MAEPDDIPVQTPRAWAHLTHTLGRHVPMRVREIQEAGRRLRATGTPKHNRPKAGK